jgi:predicted nucleic acid-binding protein
MIVVLDTSAGVDLILHGKHSVEIKGLLDDCSKVITTDLYKAETTNVFWKYVKADLISKSDAVTCINLSQSLIDEYYDISQFSIECLNEALRLDHSTYDMLYLTLAKRTGGVLLTIDGKLGKLAAKEGIDTPILGDST